MATSKSAPPIARVLESEGWRALPDWLHDLTRGLRGGTIAGPDFERRLEPDILLSRPRSKSLLLVEVKKHAVSKQGDYDPVRQVMAYVRAVRRELRRYRAAGWTVEPMLVAESFHPDVLSEASRASVGPNARGIRCAQLTEGRLEAVR